MPAGSLSIESKVDGARSKLGCSRREFLAVARAVGVPISDSEYSRAMTEKKVLDQRLWHQLAEVVERMNDLETETGLPIRWAEVDRCSRALVLKLVENSHGN